MVKALIRGYMSETCHRKDGDDLSAESYFGSMVLLRGWSSFLWQLA